ncbi:hypothetical protein MSAN_01757600 [Mycena sanguinolenta]|uniref:Uncharacterized protein n=1 Tax=Mycena sanguinolenta TaxID=230812 RepID=A0A8H6XXC6_9AGAR|nr:hypothetical protein MSAN_01757600 [Mycena sanguinolenta]
MSLSTNIPLFALFLALTPVQVQAFVTVNNGHRSTTGRIVGAIIAVVVLLAILVFACAMRRRRMRAGAGPIIGSSGYAPGGSGKFGAFGGGFNRPWGNRAAQNQNTQWQQNQNQAGNASYFPGGPSAGAKYGEPNPPPPYTNGQQGAYAPPPGPPPQAHVNDQQNNFVGGFRS